MKNDPMTILITVGAEKGFSITVKKPKFAGYEQALYMCEGYKSLFDRLLRVLGVWLRYEVTVKEKEAK